MLRTQTTRESHPRKPPGSSANRLPWSAAAPNLKQPALTSWIMRAPSSRPDRAGLVQTASRLE